jgi:hypothetical protein
LAGFRMWLGSKTSRIDFVIATCTASSAIDRNCLRVARMPCSPVIVPPKRIANAHFWREARGTISSY